jgi:AcrR family transcriptional regulator
MSTRGWAGRPPASPDEARERLMDAAIVCLQRWGLEKTGVGDIASEAGVTKPTIYAYFESRDELLQIALQRAGVKLGERILDEAQRFEDPGEQLVEAVIACLRLIPSEPGLAVNTQAQAEGFGVRGAFRAESLQIASDIIRELLRGRPDLLDDVEELAEVLIRWMLSLLIIEGPAARDENELRAFLQRRMVPGLGLSS